MSEPRRPESEKPPSRTTQKVVLWLAAIPLVLGVAVIVACLSPIILAVWLTRGGFGKDVLGNPRVRAVFRRKGRADGA